MWSAGWQETDCWFPDADRKLAVYSPLASWSIAQQEYYPSIDIREAVVNSRKHEQKGKEQNLHLSY